jgi:UDP-N-acetylglucosamine 2-epimerase (non-hydrolysing)
MIDSLHAALKKAVPPHVTLAAAGVAADSLATTPGFGVVTMHRPANVDEPRSLAELLDILREVSARLPLVWPMHPRTRASIDRLGLAERIRGVPIFASPPQGYLEMVGLLSQARLR